MIVWAGTSNLDVGMVVEHYPKVIIPERKQEIQTVPGRNGDIVLSDGSFKNYEQPYQCFLDAKHLGGLELVIPKLTAWLFGHEGYQRLEDSYFPDVYRMAYYSGGTEFISIFNEYGEGTLTFNCAPEKYLKSGERNIALQRNTFLRNPTGFIAYPEIRVTPSETNRTDVTISFTKDGVTNTMIISSSAFENGQTVGLNTKEHRAHHGTTNLNQYVTGRFENMTLGRETTITYTGNVKQVLLTPRWWTI